MYYQYSTHITITHFVRLAPAPGGAFADAAAETSALHGNVVEVGGARSVVE